MTLRRAIALIAALAAIPLYAAWGDAAYRQAEHPPASAVHAALAPTQGAAR